MPSRASYTTKQSSRIETSTIPDILVRILDRKKQEVIERSQQRTLRELVTQCNQTSVAAGFIKSIQMTLDNNKPAIIAEIKKASPSKGVICRNFIPEKIARSYEQAGASCLSVLTDIDFFQGHDNYLKQAKAAVSIPVLRKDFIIDVYQIYEARAMGSDCILLIVAALDDVQLNEFSSLAQQLGMDVLVEVHNIDELHRALFLDTQLIGINNRNLRTFETSLQTTIDLLTSIPDNRIVVTESGIHTIDDIQFMKQHQVNAFLIGEVFMRCDNPGKKLSELFY